MCKIKDRARSMVGCAKSRAKNPSKSRGKQDYDLSVEWAMEEMKKQGFKCPYTGQPYTFDNGKSWHGSCGAPGIPSINRLNAMKGYTKDNCEITSNYYNQQLMSWTHRETKRFVFGLFWFHLKKKFGLV